MFTRSLVDIQQKWQMPNRLKESGHSLKVLWKMHEKTEKADQTLESAPLASFERPQILVFHPAWQ